MEGAGAMRIDETRPLPQGVDIPVAEIVRESKGNQVLYRCCDRNTWSIQCTQPKRRPGDVSRKTLPPHWSIKHSRVTLKKTNDVHLFLHSANIHETPTPSVIGAPVDDQTSNPAFWNFSSWLSPQWQLLSRPPQITPVHMLLSSSQWISCKCNRAHGGTFPSHLPSLLANGRCTEVTKFTP